MRRLLGLRVMVVEDDYMIAIEMAGMLAAAGAVPVGPIGWPDQALACAMDRDAPLDLAVLDVNLHGTPSYAIADALIARGVPVVFVTGYSADAVDPAYRRHPRLEKPVTEAALLAVLAGA